ncbi:hypothetical protein [Roseovarius aquimarinus]|uniref:Uncharacterized protein n=1 Tax=Roseovarius aquimarinus TaxID=1229156 RepID=A0ABW7IB10_9RHOB
MVYVHKDPLIEADVLAIVLGEARRAPDARAWAEALRQRGYALRGSGAGAIVTTMPHGVEICRLPCAPSFGPAA